MTDPNSERREGPIALGLFLLSAAVLLLEVGQVRIFSFILWHHVTYLVVTVTLLGFAAGGTWLAISRRTLGEVRAGRSAFLFGLLSIVTFALLARHRLDVLPQTDVRLPALSAALSYLYLIVPFFFGGLGVAAALDGVGRSVSRRYSINMIGSALGALIAMPIIRATGGPGVVLVASGMALAAGGFFLLGAGRRRGAWGAMLAAVAAFACLPFRDAVLPFPCAIGKTLDTELKHGSNHLETYWDPICRIDAVGDEANDAWLRVYQDGDAPTWIPSAARTDPNQLMAHHLGLGYLLAYDPATKRSRDDALVIGVGGGQDVKMALIMGAQRVTAAEINESTAKMMRGRFAEYTGHLYNDPRVTVEVADGRSVIARSTDQYDIVQITGADTYAALASGANIVAESYLYTQDAIDDYIDHLKDDGVLCVVRWRFYPPRETLRLFGMAARSLKARGVEDPGRHIAVINIDNEGSLFGAEGVKARYATTIVKRTPLTAKELQTLNDFCTLHPRAKAFTPAFLPGQESEKEFVEYIAAIQRGEDAARAYEESYAYAIEPVTDDRPFFFDFFRGTDVLVDRDEEKGREVFHQVIGLGPAGMQVLWLSLIASLVLVFLLVVVPLFAFRRDGLKVQGGFRMVVFFVAVGLAYLAVEIATMQRLTLYLGHPLKALGFGLTTFLLGSGIGAAASARVAPGRERGGVLIGAAAVVVLLLAHVLGVPAIFGSTLHLSSGAREAIAVLVIAPLAFAMGLPFPLGLRLARSAAPPLLPWAFGVNGGASVIASVVAILFAMDHGFAAVLIACAGCYAVAAIALPRSRPATADGSAGTAA